MHKVYPDSTINPQYLSLESASSSRVKVIGSGSSGGGPQPRNQIGVSPAIDQDLELGTPDISSDGLVHMAGDDDGPWTIEEWNALSDSVREHICTTGDAGLVSIPAGSYLHEDFCSWTV